MNLQDAIAANVRARRARLGLTIVELAERSAGLSPNDIDLIERDAMIDLVDLPRLCIALEVDLRQLVAGADEFSALFPDAHHAGFTAPS